MSKLLVPVLSEMGALTALPHAIFCSTFVNILKNDVPSSSSKILLSFTFEEYNVQVYHYLKLKKQVTHLPMCGIFYFHWHRY